MTRERLDGLEFIDKKKETDLINGREIKHDKKESKRS